MGKKILSIIFCGILTFNLVACDSVKDLFGGKNDSGNVVQQEIPSKPAEQLLLKLDLPAITSNAFGETDINLEQATIMTEDFVSTINNMANFLDYKYEYGKKSEGFKKEDDGSYTLTYDIKRNKEYTSKSFFNQDKIASIQNELKIDATGKTQMDFAVTFNDMDEKNDLVLSNRDKKLIQAIWGKVNLDELQNAINESYKKESDKSNGIVDIKVNSGKDNVKISVYPIVTNGSREINVMFTMNM